jgi:hypothetical protein
MVELMNEARAAKAQLVNRQSAERQALRATRRTLHVPVLLPGDQDQRDTLRALIDQDFADRFARILRDTPAAERAAALVRLRELQAASLDCLLRGRVIRPSAAAGRNVDFQALAVRHRTERRDLVQAGTARRTAMRLGFQAAQDDITMPAAARRPRGTERFPCAKLRDLSSAGNP